MSSGFQTPTLSCVWIRIGPKEIPISRGHGARTPENQPRASSLGFTRENARGSRSWKRHNPPHPASLGAWPCQHPDSGPRKLMRQNKFLLCEATQFVVICRGDAGKPVQGTGSDGVAPQVVKEAVRRAWPGTPVEAEARTGGMGSWGRSRIRQEKERKDKAKGLANSGLGWAQVGRLEGTRP